MLSDDLAAFNMDIKASVQARRKKGQRPAAMRHDELERGIFIEEPVVNAYL